MDRKRVSQIKEQFDLVVHSDKTANVEFWYARELMLQITLKRNASSATAERLFHF